MYSEELSEIWEGIYENRKVKSRQSLYRKMGKVFALFAVLAGALRYSESVNPGLKQWKCIGAAGIWRWQLRCRTYLGNSREGTEQELSVHVAEQGADEGRTAALLAAAETGDRRDFSGRK